MTRTFLALVVAASTLVGTAAATYAATPLSTMQAARDSAPEAFAITVVSAKEEATQEKLMAPNCPQTIHEFVVTAKVDFVQRSASGVQKGATITFRNSTGGTGSCAIPGGNFGMLLVVGDKAAVFLKPAGTPDGALTAVQIDRLR